jgi:hypothetical protein
MDVNACDSCKKLSIEEPLLGVIETRAVRPGAMSSQPTDPLLGFRVVVLNRPVPFEEDWLHLSITMFCKVCIQRKVAELLASMSPPI